MKSIKKTIFGVHIFFNKTNIMKRIFTFLMLLLFTTPIFSQIEIHAGFDAAIKMSEKAEEIVPESGLLQLSFNAGLSYAISPTFSIGLQTGGYFSSGKYEENLYDKNENFISSSELDVKMTMIPLLFSASTGMYEDKYRWMVGIAAGPFFANRTIYRTTADIQEKKVLFGLRPYIGYDFRITENFLIGARANGTFVFSKAEDFRNPSDITASFDYDNYDSEHKSLLFYGGGSITLTYIFY